MSNNKEEHKLLGLYLFLVVCALVLFLLWIKNLYFGALGGSPFDFSDLKNDESKRSALGALGDYFGGLLNPILAFLSFIALLWTLKINQEELAETRKELARAAKAQEESKKIMDEQLKTQFLQQFESLFFSLLSQLSKNIDYLIREEKEGYSFIAKYRKVFDIESRNSKVVRKLFDQPEKDQMTLYNMRLILTEDKNFSNFFIFLYQILKNINEKFDESTLFYEDKEKIKKSYFNIVRSLIPEKVLHLLLLNVCVGEQEYNFHKYKIIVEKSQFFEHLNFQVSNVAFYPILLCSRYMNVTAFGSNKKFKEYMQHAFVKNLNDKSSDYLWGALRELLTKNTEVIKTNNLDYEEFFLTLQDNIEHIFLFKKQQKGLTFNSVLYSNRIANISGELCNFSLVESNKIRFDVKAESNTLEILILLDNIELGKILSVD